MKFLKSTIAIVALFAITAANAKVMKRTQPTTGYTPTQPVIPTPYNEPFPAIPVVVQPVTATTPAPVFYDEQTAMIKQNYLNNRARTVLTANKNNQSKTVTILTGELIKPMNKEWRKRNLKDLKSLQTIIVDQIKEAVVDAIENPMEEEMSEEEMNMRRG
jgi:hypothetical protein